MPTFPELAAPDQTMMSGMFIADNHTDPLRLHALIGALPRMGIKVLFVEAFFRHQDVASFTGPVEIQTHLDRRNFNWTSHQALQLQMLKQMAALFAIDVQGIDIPMPEGFLDGKPQYIRAIRWRASNDLNGSWVEKVTTCMQSQSPKTFAIFAGEAHGRLLKPKLPIVLYRWNGTQHEEYT
jgi:hypothetical protein